MKFKRMDTAENHSIIKGWLWLAVTSGCLVLLSWIIIHWDLDRAIAGRFYTPSDGWFLGNRQPWQWLYRYGTIPGIVLAFTSLIAWGVCLVKPRCRSLHRYFLVIVLSAVIGPGILVNGILKTYWGRPRPRQVVEFGGQWAYRHLTEPGTPGKGESFSCGHCSMGFLFCALVVFRRRRPWVAVAGGATGVILGGMLGAARMVQGAHFVSDVLWSFGIVLMVVIINYFFILQIPKTRKVRSAPMSPMKRWLTLGLLSISALAMTYAFLMHRPFYKEHQALLNIPSNLEIIALNSNAETEKLHIEYRDDRMPQILLVARGFGWTNAEHRLHGTIQYENRRINAALAIETHGYFAELSHELTVILPKRMKNRTRVELL